MDIKIIQVELKNKPEQVFTIDEIEIIYNSALEGNAVICGVIDRSEDDPVSVSNLFANDKGVVEAIKKVFTDARVGALEESTGMAGYKYQIWTKIERAIEILSAAGLTVNKYSKKEKEIEVKEPAIAAKQ